MSHHHTGRIIRLSFVAVVVCTFACRRPAPPPPVPSIAVYAAAGSSDDAILAAVAKEFATNPPDAEPSVKLVFFTSNDAESVFRDIEQSGHYKIVPQGTMLYCPWDSSTGNHGYSVGAGIGPTHGEAASATIAGICATKEQTIMYEYTYSVTRMNGLLHATLVKKARIPMG